jgi:O-antigen/teichoic acid export membrane protein
MVSGLRDDDLRRNSAFIMATTLANAVFGYGFWLYAARVFAPPDVGRATGLISAMNLAGLLATGGTGPALIADVPRLQAEGRAAMLRAVGRYTLVGALVRGALVYLLLIRLSPALARALDGWAPVVLLAGVLAQTWGVVADQTFVALRRAEGQLGRNAGFGALKLALMATIAALVAGGDRLILVSWVVASVISVAVAYRWLVRAIGMSPLARVHHSVLAPGVVVRLGLAHHVAVVAGELPMFALPTIVLLRGGAAASAFFYLTWMFGGLFFTVSASISSALFAEGSHSPEELRAHRRHAIRTALVVGTPLVAGAILLGRFALGLFGDDYAREGYGVLLLLTASALPDAITNIGVAAWRVRGRLLAVSSLTAGMAAAVLVGAWVLVPRLGVDGAGWAWLAAQSSGALVVLVTSLADRRRPPTAGPTYEEARCAS